jgi:5-methylcytosine-specific restriction endonuclease McrA
MLNLEVHHKMFRSHSGQDSEENLITLCADCHSTAHHLRELPCKPIVQLDS